MNIFPFNHTGIPDVVLLIIFCVVAAVLLTLSAFLLWFAFCRDKRRNATQKRRKSAVSEAELKLQARVSHRESTWQSIPRRDRLSAKDARELLKLNPSFNQHVLIPDPVPRNTPPSPLFTGSTISAFSHTSFSPLMNSTEHSISPSLMPPSAPSKPEELAAPYDINRNGSLSSFEHSPHLPEVGVPMTGNWQGGFKAVPVQRAIALNLPNPSIEDLGLPRTRQLRLHGLGDDIQTPDRRN